jgi:SAM-dependent methyltransferase
VRNADERRKADRAASKAGTLVEIAETDSSATLPYADASFDVVVLHASPSSEPTPEDEPTLRQCLRVLRPGGRIVVIGTGRPSGLKALLGAPAASQPQDLTLSALKAAGFGPVRAVGELEGLRFTEGLKS